MTAEPYSDLLEAGQRNKSYLTLIFKMQVVFRIEVETTLIEVETTLFYGQGTVLIFLNRPGRDGSRLTLT
jgi:hypothetical protein